MKVFQVDLKSATALISSPFNDKLIRIKTCDLRKDYSRLPLNFSFIKQETKCVNLVRICIFSATLVIYLSGTPTEK